MSSGSVSKPDSEGVLRLHRQGSHAVLEIANPKRRNAMTHDMWVSLPKLLSEHVDDDLRVLIVKGSGSTFCAGANIAEFLAMTSDPDQLQKNQNAVEQAQLALECVPCPVIAQIEGACFGGGMGLALACDFRIAASDCRFAITPARLGIAYSYADTRRLHRTVGSALCREMLLTARELNAQQALEGNLVTQVVEPSELEAAVGQWVDRLQELSPFSQRSIKRTLNTIEGTGQDDLASLKQLLLEGFRGEDLAEGAAAFLDKRPPQFGS